MEHRLHPRTESTSFLLSADPKKCVRRSATLLIFLHISRQPAIHAPLSVDAYSSVVLSHADHRQSHSHTESELHRTLSTGAVGIVPDANVSLIAASCPVLIIARRLSTSCTPGGFAPKLSKPSVIGFGACFWYLFPQPRIWKVVFYACKPSFLSPCKFVLLKSPA